MSKTPSDARILVIARRIVTARTPPGYTRGFHCAVCSAALEVSDDSLANARRGLTLCNGCGFELARRRAELKTGMELQIQPEAFEHLRESMPGLIKGMKPARVSYSTDANGRTLKRMDFSGSQSWPERPDAIPCDFCMVAVRKLWCWQVLPFCAMVAEGRSIEYKGGQWRACDPCRPLIEARDWRTLAVRAHLMSPVLAETPASALERTWTAVFASLANDEPPTQWRGGEPFPGVEGHAGTP